MFLVSPSNNQFVGHKYGFSQTYTHIKVKCQQRQWQSNLSK